MTAPEPYFEARRIGDATVTVISGGTARWRPNFALPESEWRAAIPEANAAGKIVIGFQSYHIALGRASVLVDAGLDDPDSSWGQHFAATWEDVRFSPGVVAALGAIGVSPEAITHLITTHAHHDHVAGLTHGEGGDAVPRFPRAQHLIGRADLTGSRYGEPPDSEVEARFAVIDAHQLLTPTDGDYEVAPGITMLHTPGETPGHAVVRVSSEGETCYLIGDLLHHPCEAEHLDWVLEGRDAAAMRVSRERIFATATRENAALAFSHTLFPGWGRVETTADGYRWMYDAP